MEINTSKLEKLVSLNFLCHEKDQPKVNVLIPIYYTKER